MADPVTRLNAALEGRYVIERELGEGGMATVYLADDLKHERKVALKVLKPELAAVVGAERFLAEIKTTANLTHPHILPLFDSGEADSFLFYVMPYLEGETLRGRIDREKQLPVDEAVRIATAVANALDHAHRNKIIHRDIKPANILLQDGEPVVSDFGIALALGVAGGTRLTETGLSVGTPYYMSPEQATGDQAVGAATDTYALGSVLYEMLVGDPPFAGSTAQAVLGKIIVGKSVSVTEERPAVPAHVDAAVRKALEKLPADRFASAQEFAKALGDEHFRYGELAVTTVAASSTGWRSIAGIAAVVAVVATVAAVTMALRSPDAEVSRPVRVTVASVAEGGVRPVGGRVIISPDGREIVFSGVEQGQWRLYRRALASPEVVPIPGTEDASSTMTFLPDGRSVVFWSQDLMIKRISLDGGAAVPLADVARAPVGLDWSPEAGLVMGMVPYASVGVGVMGSGAAAIREVTTPEAMHHDPYVLPNGTDALIVHNRREEGPNLIARVSLADGSTEFLDLGGSSPRGGDALVGIADDVLVFFDDVANLMAIGWDPEGQRPVGVPQPIPNVPEGLSHAKMAVDGTLAMFVSAEAYDVLLVDETGAVLSTISDESVGAAFPRFSPDGRRVAIGTAAETGSGLWLYDLEASLLSRLSMGIDPLAIDWSPDGRRIFAAGGINGPRSLRGSVLSREADASDEASVVLDLPGLRIASLSVAPDGRTLAMANNVGGFGGGSTARFEIQIARVGEGEVTRFGASGANNVAPRFSPDGRWLAYASDVSGRFEVFVRPFPGPGARVQISEAGGGQPLWSTDGGRLFYRTEQAIWAADLAGSATGGTLSVSARTRLFGGDFYGGPEFARASYDVHPDGRRFIVSRAAEGSGNAIVAWIDWLPEMKERLAN